jgi:hypothetical protein
LNCGKEYEYCQIAIEISKKAGCRNYRLDYCSPECFMENNILSRKPRESFKSKLEKQFKKLNNY